MQKKILTLLIVLPLICCMVCKVSFGSLVRSSVVSAKQNDQTSEENNAADGLEKKELKEDFARYHSLSDTANFDHPHSSPKTAVSNLKFALPTSYQKLPERPPKS